MNNFEIFLEKRLRLWSILHQKERPLQLSSIYGHPLFCCHSLLSYLFSRSNLSISELQMHFWFWRVLDFWMIQSRSKVWCKCFNCICMNMIYMISVKLIKLNFKLIIQKCMSINSPLLSICPNWNQFSHCYRIFCGIIVS